MNNVYESPLSSRYSSTKMKELFSQNYRYTLWRKLWISLAKAEKTLGLNISEQQIKELEDNINNFDYDYISLKEQEIRHDVTAHIHGYGKVAPTAFKIIHLGATSCYVTDNSDLIIYKEALKLIKEKLLSVINNLCIFALKYCDLPTLGYTHYQPAQLVTVGKRATLWIQDLIFDLDKINYTLSNIKFLGCRGTTGTEASFMNLFDNDISKIDKMNEIIAKDFDFCECFDVCGQTYPRKIDSTILDSLSSIGQTCYKIANDIRLLQHDKQVEEPFEDGQVGSSAMAYKRNPMRCERICSLSRYLMTNSLNASLTASTQWFERTLDDSAIRRISMPEGFLCADSVLRLLDNVTENLVVNKKIIEDNVNKYLPFIATENIMMEAVKKGSNRQEVHEIIRKCSIIANDNIKNGKENNLIELLSLQKELNLSIKEIKKTLDPSLYIGRSSMQTKEYVNKILPLLTNLKVEKEEIEL